MHISLIITTLLSTALAVPSTLHPRDDTCDSIQSIIDRIGKGNGNRKIGFVIDASGSMSSSDPSGNRRTAAKKLSGQLNSNDQVAVVDFGGAGDTRLLYSLGAPSGAGGAIDRVNQRGSTFIGGGIKVALDEVTKAGSGDTKGRTALIVLTDGEDSSNTLLNQTIGNVTTAGSQGVRVHFGFLQADNARQDPRLQEAIRGTGGFFGTINTADQIDRFIAAVLANGLTPQDGGAGNGGTILLPGLKASSTLSKSGPEVYKYSARSGERLNVTVSAITRGLGLKETVKSSSGSELASAQSNSTGIAYLEYTATKDEDLTVEVSGTGSVSEGLFSIVIGSSSLCGGLSNGTTPTTSNNGTTNNTSSNPTPTSSQPPVYTGAAASVATSMFWGCAVALAGVAAML